MKPHEETFEVLALSVKRSGHGGEIVARSLVTCGEDTRDAHLRARFFAAAPEMARALLAQGHVIAGEWHSRYCRSIGAAECAPGCAEARDALKSAGAL